MAVTPVPEDHPVVSPYLIVEGATRLLEFVQQVFDAEVTFNSTLPDGTIGHASVRIGDSVVMMGDAGGPWEPMPASLHIYVEDVDASYRRALEAGATSLREPRDEFYGDRTGGVQDPVGNRWWLASRIEALSDEELKRRADEAVAKHAAGESGD